MLESEIENLLDSFKALMFSNDQSFQAFDLADIQAFYQRADQFSLRFKRIAGAYILYGLPHVEIRRQFFNQLSIQDRRNLFIQKVNHQALSEWIESSLSICLEQCEIVDIGMGSTVYRIQGPNNRAWVLKREEQNYFGIYQQFLSNIGMPSVSFFSQKKEDQEWLLMEDKGALTLNEYLLNKPDFDEYFIQNVAKHAFYGDLLQRGERHSENYLVKGQHLYPIDITYLFYPNNNFWTARYMAAGAYEASICVNMETQRLDEQKWGLFWEAYRKEAFTVDRQVLEGVESQYTEYFFKEPSLWFEAQYDAYLANIKVYLYRLGFKDLLNQLGAKELLSNKPLLKMYYYANKKRTQAFLHLEEHSLGLLHQIQELAGKESVRKVQMGFEESIQDLKRLRI